MGIEARLSDLDRPDRQSVHPPSRKESGSQAHIDGFTSRFPTDRRQVRRCLRRASRFRGTRDARRSRYGDRTPDRARCVDERGGLKVPPSHDGFRRCGRRAAAGRCIGDQGRQRCRCGKRTEGPNREAAGTGEAPAWHERLCLYRSPHRAGPRAREPGMRCGHCHGNSGASCLRDPAARR